MAGPPAGTALRRELWLWCGLHRTATTSLQLSCAAHRAGLLQRGVRFPLYTFGPWAGCSNHSMLLVNAFSQRPEGYHMNPRFGLDPHAAQVQMRQQLRAVVDATPPQDTLLLVAEDVSLMTLPELEALAAWFDGAGLVCRPWLVQREPLALWESHLSQRVLSGQTLAQAWDWLASLPSPSQRQRRLERVFGRLQVLDFSQACSHPQGPVGHYLQALGLAGVEAWPLVQANRSPSELALRLLSELNEQLPPLLPLQAGCALEGPWRPHPQRRPGDQEGLVRALAGPALRLRGRDRAALLADRSWLGRVTAAQWQALHRWSQAPTKTALKLWLQGWLRSRQGDEERTSGDVFD